MKRRRTRQREPIIFGVLAVASLGIQSEVGRYFKTLGESHSADPLAMWCGEGEKKTFPYPIRLSTGPKSAYCSVACLNNPILIECQ